jgi:hypothetical protein
VEHSHQKENVGLLGPGLFGWVLGVHAGPHPFVHPSICTVRLALVCLLLLPLVCHIAASAQCHLLATASRTAGPLLLPWCRAAALSRLFACTSAPALPSPRPVVQTQTTGRN